MLEKEYDVLVVQSRYYTLPEVAERLNVSRRTVYRWIQAGELSAHKLGPDRPGVEWRIGEEDLERFLEERRRGS
jgi:excisionase family DNA binding protein